ncbi:MAG: hypothetical protein CL467_08210 [Acidimicrobiaceae bacterium]|mgnify:CR=1 FL=1|nr:hypothetical protein [Acidimicrobiaceae bacterium]
MRVRIRFTKVGKVRFTSHRDVARIWERAVRRAGIAVAYSQGFSPRPKLSFGLALSTGHESVAEYLDADLLDDRFGSTEAWGAGRSKTTSVELMNALNGVLPAGMDVIAVAPAPGGDSLQQAVVACTWAIHLDNVRRSDAESWVAGVLARRELVVERERKGKPVVEDLRPQVLALSTLDDTRDNSLYAVESESEIENAGLRLLAELGTQPRALRPTELLAAVGPPLAVRSVCRMNQWMLQGADREEPLPVAVAPAPSTKEST